MEVARPKRPARRSGAKTDAIDAIRAVRETLGHQHQTLPRRRDVKRCLKRSIARQLFKLLERYDQPGVEIITAA